MSRYGKTGAVLLRTRQADDTPTPAADPAVLVALRAKGYQLQEQAGFMRLIVPVAEVIDLVEVNRELVAA